MDSKCKDIWLIRKKFHNPIVASPSVLCAFRGLLPLLLIAGCTQNEITPMNLANTLNLQGVVQVGQQPIAGSQLSLYATISAGDGSDSTLLLSQQFQTDGNGRFAISGAYVCPSPTSVAYLIARDGEPPSSPGSANPSIALMTALGPCDTLSTVPFATVNEITTVGSIWPLAPYAKSMLQIGSSSSDRQAFDAAAATVGELVGVSDGIAPGPMLPTGDVAPMAKLYSLANMIANCLNSTGGSAGDGSPCGGLFSDATVGGAAPPSDTLTAALAIAQNPSRNVVEIFDLSSTGSANQPALKSPPADWTLPILAIPEAPTMSPDTQMLMPGQSISINEDTAGAAVYYTTDGTPPSEASQPYSGPIALTNTATVSAIAIKASVNSSIVSQLFKLAAISVALTPASITLAPAQTQLFTANVVNTSNPAVTWALNPAVGSISNGGFYTAPASVGNAQSVQVTATSVADPTKSASAGILLAPTAVAAPASLSVSTQGPLTFSATQGSSSPATQSITVNNSGNGPLQWSVASNASWLTFGAASNLLAAGASTSLALIVNPTGLGLGIHTTVATIGLTDVLYQLDC
jgi:hypothetical protein